MNKFVLNFSDFILNENNRVNKTLNNTLLYEDQVEFSEATTEEIIKDRLLTKLQNVCKNTADADRIVEKSKDLINAAVKVYNKEPDSNFFKEHIGYILTAGAGAVVAGAFIISKKGKKIPLGNTLRKIIVGIKTKFQNPIKEIISSKWPTVQKPYDDLILNCNSTLKYIKNIENKSYYTNLNTKGKQFFINIEKITNALKTSFDEQYTYINDTKMFKEKILQERLGVIKNEIINYTTIIKSQIEDLKLQNIDDLVKTKPIQADSKIITMPDYSSNKINSNEIWNDIKTIISKNENFIKNFRELDLACNDILKTSGITKPSTTGTIDDAIKSTVNAAGKQITITQPPSKFIERVKKYGITSLAAVGSIYLIKQNYSVISELFKDSPEIVSTINIVDNPQQSKEYFVQQMKDALPTFSYDNWFSGLNAGDIEFKQGYEIYKSNLKGAILYDLAQLIINDLKEISAIYMYGILEKTTQA